MCGEHHAGRRQAAGTAGSSPHVRGARLRNMRQWLSPGIIPACAGSTIVAVPSYLPSRDHPRMCGEHSALVLDADGLAGIIPACAGSTILFIYCYALVWDHPRMCGEHPAVELIFCTAAGSSPHVRGAPANALHLGLGEGIIPACAGSTTGLDKIFTKGGDHPRMCGEHRRSNMRKRMLRGSSPHVRGAPIGCGERGWRRGIIPACAGSTMRANVWTAR